MKTQTAFARYQSATRQTWSASALVALRVVLGFQFLLAGIAKFGDWTAAGYLAGATGPFAGFFQSLAGSVVVDQFNIWGLTLIGIALIVGACVRPAAFFGAIMMALYYFAHFEQNTAHGFIDEHIVYIFVFLVFMAGGVGHILGLDQLLHRYLSKRKHLANLLFG